MCSFCSISCLPYSIFCIHLKKLLSAIVISLHLEEKRLFDSFSAVSQISLTLYVVISIVLQGKTKPLQFISIQNCNLLILQYIYLYYWYTCTVYYIFKPVVIAVRTTAVFIVVFCLEAVVSQLTSSPDDPTIANETSDLTLMWKYNAVGSILFATFVRGGDRIARRVGANDIIVEAKYQDRFRANISDSQAWLKILRVQRSDEGMYDFRLEPGAGDTISGQLKLIVHCKCLPLLIQIKVFIQ